MSKTDRKAQVKCMYGKGDLRRMLMVLGAIDQNGGATLVQVAEATGLDKKTVQDMVGKATSQAGVQVEKKGAVYSIDDWGPVLKKSGARLALQGNLGEAPARAQE